MNPTPTVADREQLLKMARAARLERSWSALSPIEPVDRGARLALSFAQQRLWFLEELGGMGSTYHVRRGLRLKGGLDRAALVRALDRIVARHETLRTTVRVVDGEPEQRIAPAGESAFALLEHDLGAHPDAEAELLRLAAEEAAAPFDLERGPLIRGRLVRMGDDDHALLVTMHHIVSDGWSMGVLVHELGVLYGAYREGGEDPLPPLPVQYADYAAWQRRWMEGEVLRAQADYWKRTLAGAPALLELPTDRPRPARQDHSGASVAVELDEVLAERLRALGRRHGTTPFMTLLAGWAVVLGRLSGQTDVVVGTPTANRGRREVEGMIGAFLNTLALRVDLSGSPTAAELLGRVRERVLEAQQNQDIPFEQVVELVQPARSLAHSPLFQAMLTWQNAPRDRLELSGLALAPVHGASQETAKFDLSLDLWEAGGRIAGRLEYATALFDRATVERFVGYLRRLLEAFVADDGRPVERLELLPEAERRLVIEAWNATGAGDAGGVYVHALFEEQAGRTPDAAAVVHEGRSLTYAELNVRANRLAHHLRGLGVGPDARVAICVERGPEMLVGVLGVLKAGGAYVPLDPSYPADRLRYMLADSRPVALLTQASLAGRFAGLGVPALDLLAPTPEWADAPSTNPDRAGLAPGHLAYAIYTSGSTGRPKGVMIEHRSIANAYLAWEEPYELRTRARRHLQMASFSFDVFTGDWTRALCSGGTLVVCPRELLLEPERLYALLERERIQIAEFVPAVLRELVKHLAASGRTLGFMRVLVCGSDTWSVDEYRHFLSFCGPETRLVNSFGLTEATIDSTFFEARSLEGVHGDQHVPIGRPFAGTTLFILDAHGEPVPIGVAGELYVGGRNLARGYHGRPELTAEKFVASPFGGAPGGRLYRTGDGARWRPDGNVEFLGRLDGQVKVRGFRVELAEVEARLAAHPAVRDAIVAARGASAGDRRLVAYYVGEPAPAEALRAHLAEQLPDYMVPAAYVRLEALPLTPNGKVDRGALPEPGGEAYAARAYEPPLGEAEAALAEIWAELLGVERVGRHDHFFDLGGHSLRAMQVVSRVRQALGVEAAVGDLFARPVLADFARGLEHAARADLPPIGPAAGEERLALSFAQQRLWFLDRLDGAGAAYHLPFGLRLRGELDRAALERALDRIVDRHEALRTTFPEQGGVPVQRIAPAGEAPLLLAAHDLGGHPGAGAELDRLIAEEARAPFDLAGGPVVRGRLVRLAADDHVLLVTMHHIASDGWSLGVFVRELGALYAAFRRGEPDPLPPLPVQYADYAAWQRRWVKGEVLEAQAEYWTRALAGAPELLELPTDHARAARRDHAGAAVEVALGEELTAGLRALSRRHGTTLFMTLLAGWAAVLGRLSGQTDVVVGTPTAGRGRREIEGLIGFFVNTLALRVDLAGSPTVAELLGRVRARALEAQQNQDIPFEQVVERVQPARSLAHTPIFQVMLAWQNTPGARLELPGLTLAPVGRSAQAATKFDLSLSLGEARGRITGSVTYATSLFERATVESWLGALRSVLEAMAADERLPVDDLPLLPETERRRVLEEWSRGEAEDDAGGGLVHRLFEAQAERTPGAVAVVGDAGALTYAELNRRANRLAHLLRQRGVGPDARVALCAEPGPEAVAGVLAVLKAGGAFVPLDPSHPEERLRWLLADSAPAALLAEASLAGRFAGSGVPVVRLDAGAGAPETNPPGAGLAPDHLAYVVYTSGSTGRPKGAMVSHRSLAGHLRWASRVALGGGVEELPWTTRLSFDAALKQVLGPLLRGGAVWVLAPGVLRDPAALLEALGSRGAPLALNCVPSLWSALLGAAAAHGAPAGLARLLLGGEAVAPELLERTRALVPGVEVWNLYGPTETTVNAAAGRVEPGRAGIGRPVAGARAYVLDGRLHPVPVGVPGELFVAGRGVARGYLGRPGLTAERFLPDPLGGAPGERMYRTGDRARWRADGRLEFLGRADFQVKVRGFRVEPGEVEARLLEHPEVREAVVAAREDAHGETRLVAYCVASGAVDAEGLRAHLAARLPEYMVPAAYVRLEALPRTPGGKVHRAALPAPEGDAYAARAYQPPAGEAEQALAEVWADVLGVERVGRWDHFFELGGHSLLAVQVVSRLRQVLGVEAALGEVFERPVLADFARGLAPAARAELPEIGPADRTGRLPLSFAQQRLWFLEQLGGLGGAYHVRRGLRLRGELDRAALSRALDRVVARHEALRTTFAVVDGEPEQRIAPAEESRFALAGHDLSGSADLEGDLRRLVLEEAEAPFDLERGPLIRGRLVRLAEDDHVLLLAMHHIVADAWSMWVLVDELGALYAAFRRGGADPLPALPVQYADYAAWQRRWVDGEVLRRQADYWTGTLAGAPELLELPTDHPRPARQDHAGASVRVELDEELAAGLRTLSRRQGTTLFMTLLAGWATVLGRLSGQDDVVVGTPAANRGRREIEGLIGFFVNPLAVRVDLSGSPTVAELLGRVKARSLGAQQNQDIPFEQVVERVRPVRSLAHTPLFQVLFTWQNAPGGSLELPGLELAPVPGASRETAKFDLSLSLAEAGGRIVGSVTYATALFEAATVERHVGYLRRVLEAMAADELRRVDALPLLPDAERRRVLEEWNATDAEYPREACLHELFEAQVRRTPGAAAVVHAGQALTYAELNARANRLAHHLRALGVGPDARVALCVERGLDMMVGLLAVLKAGGAYVPLDPAYPPDRLRHMLTDSAPVALLTRRALAGRFGELRAPVVALDADARAWASLPGADPDRAGLTPEHLAYVIYTSGSTGRAKGVLLEHRNAVNFVSWARAAFAEGDLARTLFSTSLNFDLAVFECFVPLSVGATVHLAADALELVTHPAPVTLVNTVPSAMKALVEAGGVPPSARVVNLAGEPLKRALVEAIFAGTQVERVCNLYGPSETTTYSTWVAMRREEGFAAHIGRPLANTRVYVLDAAGEPVPVGVAGELYIGGAGVARGYLDRPELTAERFVADPFGAEPGARLYRTGDLARWRADGTLEFLGRNDFQVKIRGFRVEPGEVEARLAEHPEVREAVVLAREDAPGEKRLVAYYVGEAVGAEALRAHLAAKLPEHMVPAAYVRLEALPLTPNGKVDRKALPAPEGDAYVRRGWEAPASETEAALAELWTELLGVERVGRHDNFFELGGHSLLAVRLIQRMRRRGLHAEVGALFTTPTLAELAGAVGRESLEAEVPPNRIPTPCDVITPEMLPLVELSQAEVDAVAAGVEGGAANVQDVYPLAPLQEGMLFHHTMTGEGDPYVLPVLSAFDRRERLDAYLAALQAVIDRHDVLRTSVAWEGLREPVQVVWRRARLRVEEVELDPAAGDAAQQLYARFDPRRHRLDLHRAPLMRVCVARDAARERWLLLVLQHHLVSDHTTGDMVQEEVEAHLAGRADALPAPLPFRNYVAQTRLGASRAGHEAYFRALLGDVDEPTAPFGLLDAWGDGSGIADARLPVDAALAARLRERARALGVSAASVCHLAWALLLARVSGRADVVSGTVLFGRMRGGEGSDRALGPFINTLPVRVRVGADGVEAGVRAMHRQLAELLRHEHASLALAQRCSGVAAPAPLFTAVFSYRHSRAGGAAGAARPDGAPEGMQRLGGSERTNYPVTVYVDDRGEGFGLKAQVPASVGPERVCAMLHRALEGVVEALETAPARPLADVDVLPPAERRQVVEGWNATEAEYPRGLCVHELFEAQAARTPDAVALTFAGRS
ncbi:MAG TPA: amino acid adenylation domain-containing protein, partial [Longimicrobium sp.]